jgi:LytS/YehU family sensor histidine kinase
VKTGTAGWFDELRAILAVNTLIGLALTALALAFSRNAREEWGALVYSNQVYAHVIGGLAALSIPRIGLRLSRVRPEVRWPVYVLLLAAAGLGGAALAGLVLVATGVTPASAFGRVLGESARFAVFLTITIGIAAYLVESTKHRLHQTTLELRTHQLEREHASKLAAEAQLNSLASRLRPHFLFNTINSILALIQDDPRRAAQMLERLSRLLRYSLETQDRHLVPLDEELRLLRDYLDIEQERFGPRLRFTMAVPPELGARQVPPFSLQTLVENSMKYAVAARRDGGTIEVSAREDRGLLELAVQDDGSGFSRDDITPGHGLDTLERRLAALYGARAALAIENGAGARVTVRVPA